MSHISNTQSKTKICSSCRRILPVSHYNNASSPRDGLCSYCRDCDAERFKTRFKLSLFKGYKTQPKQGPFRPGRKGVLFQPLPTSIQEILKFPIRLYTLNLRRHNKFRFDQIEREHNYRYIRKYPYSKTIQLHTPGEPDQRFALRIIMNSPTDTEFHIRDSKWKILHGGELYGSIYAASGSGNRAIIEQLLFDLRLRIN